MKNKKLSRRNFVKFGGAVVAGSTMKLSPFNKIVQDPDTSEEKSKIREYRTLGRTGFKVSDIGMGTTRLKESSVIRYAYDKGINYFDTAEGYTNGLSEKLIGEALQHMERKNVFITTKLHLDEDETKESILERFRKCQERLKTDYVNALYTHNPSSVAMLSHPGFHAAIKELKQQGKVKHAGVSNHGSQHGGEDTMEKILCAAAEDGRFDLMLLIYNFLNKEAGDKIIATCKKYNVGTTAMKTSPGIIKVDPFDPDNPTEEQQKYLDRIMARGNSREKALDRLKSRLKRQEKNYKTSKPFVEKYGIKTAEQLQRTSVQWSAQNHDMHSTCVSLRSFDIIDMVIPISGKKLSEADNKFLEEFKLVFNDQYCRHGCNECSSKCPHDVPVNTIMRYAYYYDVHGIEKYAMQKYANLKQANALICESCYAPCISACPFGVDVQTQLAQAHSLLTLV